MRAVDLIRRKRDGGELTADEIRFLVGGIASREVPEYQWSALTMAILWRGMTPAETAALVEAMLHSGTVIDLSDLMLPPDRSGPILTGHAPDLPRPIRTGPDRS